MFYVWFVSFFFKRSEMEAYDLPVRIAEKRNVYKRMFRL
jgi:hypothetical protein